MSKIPIVISPDHFHGHSCVQNEVPWQAEGSIRLLDDICAPGMTALELGSGGSTLFYSRRISKIVSVETEPLWHSNIDKILKEKGIVNVENLLAPSQKHVFATLDSILKQPFDIVSVDSAIRFDRSIFLNKIFSSLNKQYVKIVVLDNYASSKLFKSHFALSGEQLISNLGLGQEWKCFDFDVPKWHGNGTRVLTSISVKENI